MLTPFKSTACDLRSAVAVQFPLQARGAPIASQKHRYRTFTYFKGGSSAKTIQNPTVSRPKTRGSDPCLKSCHFPAKKPATGDWELRANPIITPLLLQLSSDSSFGRLGIWTSAPPKGPTPPQPKRTAHEKQNKSRTKVEQQMGVPAKTSPAMLSKPDDEAF